MIFYRMNNWEFTVKYYLNIAIFFKCDLVCLKVLKHNFRIQFILFFLYVNSEREFHVIHKIESDFCDIWNLTFKCGLLVQKEEVIVVV